MKSDRRLKFVIIRENERKRDREKSYKERRKVCVASLALDYFVYTLHLYLECSPLTGGISFAAARADDDFAKKRKRKREGSFVAGLYS